MEKMDARKRYTQMVLKQSFLKLLKEKPVNRITVKEVCALAQLNRATFYAHYEDIYDLMEQVERQIRRELSETLREQGVRPENVFHRDLLIHFLRHIGKNRNFYRICLRHRVRFPLEEGFGQLGESVVKAQCRRRGVADEDAMLYYLTFYQAGFTSVLRKWVEDGCRETPEALCAILRNCLPETELL